MSAQDVASLQRWLLTAPHLDDGGLALMRGLVDELTRAGLPLWRCSFAVMTKHPELVWHTIQWREEEGVKRIDRKRELLDDSFFTKSPMPLLQKGAPSFRERLVGTEPLRFPVCDDLRALGGTDYFVQALRFSTGVVGYVSWATRAAGGFDDASVALLEALGPSLAQRIELASAYHAIGALLEVYLGHNAGQRVARGEFRRGGGELIEAAIWFCDMRDFTSFSDANAPETVVATLNDYFDRVAGAVMEQGGEILKFIGDAILAVFPIAGDPADACRRARAAADGALSAIAGTNIRIGVALHLGKLMYGNVGARERLDFTVISAAVNETCRLESLCKPLATPLTMSESFTRASKADDVVDLGEHTLKGVRTPVRVFTASRYRP